MYKVFFYDGITSEDFFNSEEDLRKSLRAFYLKHKDEGHFYNVAVFNDLNEDISDSQFITELIGGFLEDE